jgi:hypothetical protein
MQFDQAKPVPPRTFGEAVERVEAGLAAAGTAGIVNGAFLATRWVDVRLTDPYAGTLEELTQAIRDDLGEGIEVTVRFYSA